ncbi:MAG: type II toxin-antitoxin system RelE/ParE family toxin, partial [Schwartzia sp.]|nr:type II toxin-antitoxin system RelE/ParE family toxin [Schwartzia sp. (in: firmicutes)]
MKYAVNLSDEANADLREIFRYIAIHLQSPENAVGQLQRLEQHIRGLDEFPYRFRKYEKGVWKKRGLRVMPVDRYCVFYIPNDATKTVTI